MFQKFTLACLSLGLLAGCGVSPVVMASNSASAGAAALVDTSRYRKTIVVPADVMKYADDYIAQMHAKYDKGDTSAHLAIALEASPNNFRQIYDAAVDQSTNPRSSGAQSFLLDESAPTGTLTYYLVVTGTVVSTDSSHLSMTSLPDFYVSNYGKNFTAVAK